MIYSAMIGGNWVMHRGGVGLVIQSITKLILVSMLMGITVFICVLIGYFDAPDILSSNGPAAEEIIGSVFSLDVTAYAPSASGAYGILGSILSVAVDFVTKIYYGSVKPSPSLEVDAVALLAYAAMSFVLVSGSTKVYYAFAGRMNRRNFASLRNQNALHLGYRLVYFLTDTYCILFLVVAGLLCVGCLVRRATILTASIPYGGQVVLYILLILLVSFVYALVGSRKKKGLLTVFIDTALEVLYGAITSVCTLCVSATILLFNAYVNQANVLPLYGLLFVFLSLLVLSVWLPKRKRK